MNNAAMSTVMTFNLDVHISFYWVYTWEWNYWVKDMCVNTKRKKIIKLIFTIFLKSFNNLSVDSFGFAIDATHIISEYELFIISFTTVILFLYYWLESSSVLCRTEVKIIHSHVLNSI